MNLTTKIVAEQGASALYAAGFCDQFSLNNKTDWYLPNLNDWRKVCRANANNFLQFSGSQFYCGSEVKGGAGFMLLTQGGDFNIVSTQPTVIQGVIAKSLVRPMRRF